MKKNISYPAVMTGLFCAFLGLGTALSVFMPRRTFSETENRYLAKRPALTWESVKSGKFGSGYEIYLSDQFPFRDSWIGFKTAAEKVQLKKEINGVFLGKDGYLIEAFYPEDMDPALSEKNLDTLTAFALRQEELLGEGHVKILLAPTASEILTEKLPASAAPFSQAAVTDFLENAGLSSMMVPVKDALLQESSAGPDRPLYYRTDHHWTAHGAYTAYRTWAAGSGLMPLETSGFSVETVSQDFLGTIHSKLNVPVKPDSIELYRPVREPEWSVFYDGSQEPVHSLYSMEALKTRDKYRVYLDGNHGLTKIVNPQAGGSGKLLIIKDSYAHCFAPFAALHFPETLMIDLRYYNGKPGDLIRDQEITDVLVLYQIPGFLKDRNISKLAWG